MNHLLWLLFVLSLGAAQRSSTHNIEWDNKAEAEKVNLRGCANLTLVLDNWKYAIMTQVKDLLLNDHNTVLPDYERIKPLSEALNDLYSEFNSLKERLAELTTKFEGIEMFVEDVRGSPRRDGESARQGRKNKVVVRRVKKPDNPQV
ncbi:hypothetical protein E1301_Tti010591 [Triplophysa tibetana]|uniref:Uncharacterized protein n=1 Tax=Triplophysa tibetana TaxID=1572043 RepID=A0A5A9PY15_9TELE|nr:hypothetical protein E1301_Tti010591 [Triplophysa tibetana]